MPMNYWTGVLTGVVAVWLFHHFVQPMPGPNTAAKRGAGA